MVWLFLIWILDPDGFEIYHCADPNDHPQVGEATCARCVFVCFCICVCVCVISIASLWNRSVCLGRGRWFGTKDLIFTEGLRPSKVRLDAAQQRQEWISNLASFRSDSIELQLSDLPSLCDLEAAYRRVSPGKATGPDGVEAALCHAAPAAFARKTYALLLKTYVHGQECLLHKGGRLHPLWKGKGAKDSCASYRSILVSSHVGKSLHRCLRLHSATLFETYMQKQQLGGKRRIAVGLGVHQARAYLRSRRLHGLNVGMIFLDLCEAFYRIVRELAIGGPADDETIARMGARLGMGPDLLHALYHHLNDEHATSKAGMGHHMQKMVRALHADTHFFLAGQQDHCKTRLGTRPGDSWADIIFSFPLGQIAACSWSGPATVGLSWAHPSRHRATVPQVTMHNVWCSGQWYDWILGTNVDGW